MSLLAERSDLATRSLPVASARDAPQTPEVVSGRDDAAWDAEFTRDELSGSAYRGMILGFAVCIPLWIAVARAVF